MRKLLIRRKGTNLNINSNPYDNKQTPVGGEIINDASITEKINKYDLWKIHSNINIDYETYFNNIVNKIDLGENFTFLRLCDGDYHNIFFKNSPDGKMDDDSINLASDKELYILKIKNDALKNKDIIDDLIIGMQFGTQYDGQFNEVLKEYDLVTKEGYSAALFSWAYATDNIDRLFFAIRNTKKPIIMVGPEYFINIDVFNIDSHICTPEDYTWLYQDEIENKLNTEIEHFLNNGKNPIIIYSCSVTGKIAISNFYKKYKNQITQLDIGSNLNPYVNKLIRGWQINEKKNG